mgnify:CR=1 FL=1
MFFNACILSFTYYNNIERRQKAWIIVCQEKQMNNQKLKAPPGRPTIYRKLKNNIVADIASSKLQPGEFYSTELELSRRFGVGRSTVRKAVTEIERAELIIRRKRVGLLAGDRISSLSNASPVAGRRVSSPPRIVLVLPFWDQNAGGFYSNNIITELRLQGNGDNWIIDVRPYDDALNHIGSDVEAVIAVDPRNHGTCAKLQAMSENNIKVVIIEPPDTRFDFAVCIRPNMYKATVGIVKEFINLGHKNVGIINSSLDHDTYRQLLEGFIAAHRECQLPIHPDAIIQYGELEFSQLDVDVRNITAWICSNDGCLDFIARACNIKHLKVPEDISVIGVDDPGDSVCHSLGTTLSVMRPDYSLVGELIHQLIHNWSEYNPGDIVELPIVNIPRNSIGPVKSS